MQEYNRDAYIAYLCVSALSVPFLKLIRGCCVVCALQHTCAHRCNIFSLSSPIFLFFCVSSCYNPLEIQLSPRRFLPGKHEIWRASTFLRSPPNGHRRRPRQSGRTCPSTDRKTVREGVDRATRLPRGAAADRSDFDRLDQL